MYVMLKKNLKKDSYIFEIADEGFEQIIDFAKGNNVTRIEGILLQMVCDRLASRPIKDVPSMYMSRKTKMNKIIINRPNNEKEDGVGYLRELTSLTIKEMNPNTNNSYYIIFGEVSSENVKSDEPLMYSLTMFGLLKREPMFIDSDGLTLLKIRNTNYKYVTICTSFIDAQVSIYFDSDAKLNQIYSYGLVGETIMSNDKQMSINFCDFYALGRLDINSSYFCDFELFIELKRILGKRNINFKVLYHDMEIDFPIITSMEFSFDDFMEDFSLLDEVCKMIHEYNLSAVDENRKLTIKDYGYKNLSLNMIDKDVHLGKLRRYLADVKALPPMYNGFKTYTSTITERK